MKNFVFQNRVHAGQMLGESLMKYAGRKDVIVLGLPRGGVPVAYEVAKKLHAPLDVLVVRKLGVPGYEELAMGAIASGGVMVIHNGVMRDLGIPRTALDAETAVQLKELHRREVAYRGHTGIAEIQDKIVILVDDGIATGSTIRAAVQALRQQHPQQIIIAVPVAAAGTCADLGLMSDKLIALMTPENFRGVGQWYEDFSQTTDTEVKHLLAKAALVPSETSSDSHN